MQQESQLLAESSEGRSAIWEVQGLRSGIRHRVVVQDAEVFRYTCKRGQEPEESAILMLQAVCAVQGIAWSRVQVQFKGRI